MTLTRGKIVTGADGFRNATNTDSPFVDQSQTYTSHASHQVFLREYVNNSAGKPVTTGKFLSAADASASGMANWAQIKEQAATHARPAARRRQRQQHPAARDRPVRQVHPGPERPAAVRDGVRPGRGRHRPPVPVPANALLHRHRVPERHRARRGADDLGRRRATPDTDVRGRLARHPSPAGSYDNELLDLHFICGDGRCNENIALSAVHQIFHSEHDRLIDAIKDTLLEDTSPSGSHLTTLADWQTPLGAGCSTAGTASASSRPPGS